MIAIKPTRIWRHKRNNLILVSYVSANTPTRVHTHKHVYLPQEEGISRFAKEYMFANARPSTSTHWPMFLYLYEQWLQALIDQCFSTCMSSGRSRNSLSWWADILWNCVCIVALDVGVIIILISCKVWLCPRVYTCKHDHVHILVYIDVSTILHIRVCTDKPNDSHIPHVWFAHNFMHTQAQWFPHPTCVSGHEPDHVYMCMYTWSQPQQSVCFNVSWNMPTCVCVYAKVENANTCTHIIAIMPSVYVHMSEISPSSVWTHECKHACKCMRERDHGSLSRIHPHTGAIMPTPMCAYNSVGSHVHTHICAIMPACMCTHRRNHARIYVHT